MSDNGADDQVEELHDPLGWWTISGTSLIDVLRRAAAGENPDLIFAEIYANAEREHP